MLLIITFILAFVLSAATISCFITMFDSDDTTFGGYGLIGIVLSAYLWWVFASIINYENNTIPTKEKTTIEVPKPIEPNTTEVYTM